MSSSSHAPPPYAALHAGPALREHASTSFFSPYRKFWRGTNWHKFLLPPKAIPGGQHIASQDPEAAFEAAVAFATKEKINATLKGWPAVYEFAIVHPRNPKRVKVYVGKASGRGPADNPSAGGLKQRQGDYLNPKKNHIKDLMGKALADGCMIVRRFRYILFEDCAVLSERDQQLAEAYETLMLASFDYAWNTQNNKWHNTQEPTRTIVYNTGLWATCCGMTAARYTSQPNLRTHS